MSAPGNLVPILASPRDSREVVSILVSAFFKDPTWSYVILGGSFLFESASFVIAVRQFLRTVRGSACKRFTTVLSPDYNAAHHDHLHVEVGSSRFCG